MKIIGALLLATPPALIIGLLIKIWGLKEALKLLAISTALSGMTMLGVHLLGR